MATISFDSSGDQFVIRIDKDQIDKERLFRFLDSLRVEALAEHVSFTEEIEALGKEIKSNWWKANKSKFIPSELEK
jgi:hypothetical protein